MEDQKTQNQPIPFKKASAWKAILGKKWAFPAIYIGTAAIILAFVMWYQGNAGNYAIDKSQWMQGVSTETPQAESKTAVQEEKTDAVPASKSVQPLAWPIASGVKYQVGMEFFDDQSPAENQQAALVKYEDSFMPHTGIDLKATDGKAFDVTAALPGKVTKVENDPLVGYLVEVEHPDNMVTVYQSLEKVTVKPGDQVNQGQVLGTAGRNVYEKDAGVHLHFEVRVNGNPVNPKQYLTQTETQ